MKKKGLFLKGIKDGIPICLGYISVAFAFGIFASKSGLTVLQTLLISMANVTSAGQLAAVPIICAGGSLAELGITQLVINLRYSLMSLSLSQKLDGSVRLIDRFFISFVNTDEVFAVASEKKHMLGRRYLYGLILTPYLGWSAGTLLGAAAGSVLPEIVISSLGVAIYGMFIAIVLPEAKASRSVMCCVLISALISCAFKYLSVLKNVPSGFVIIIAAVFSSVLMAYLAPVKAAEAQQSDEADKSKEAEVNEE